MFTEEIIKELGFYVYRLIDPRYGQTFYVGKGKRNRVFEHDKDEIDPNEDELPEKLERIHDIRKSGFKVTHVIHRHGLDEDTALEVEAALIDAYPGVTNINKGHCRERGIMHSKQIIDLYQASEIDFKHKVLMITINKSLDELPNIYEAVRYAWKLDPRKAEKAEYVLAMDRGLVIGVFIVEKWLEATHQNFPNKENEAPGRYGFIGHEAPDEIKELYLDTRLPNHMKKRGVANPIRYYLD